MPKILLYYPPRYSIPAERVSSRLATQMEVSTPFTWSFRSTLAAFMIVAVIGHRLSLSLMRILRLQSRFIRGAYDLCSIFSTCAVPAVAVLLLETDAIFFDSRLPNSEERSTDMSLDLQRKETRYGVCRGSSRL